MTVLSSADAQSGEALVSRNGGPIAYEPASIDLHLGGQLLRPEADGVVDVTDEDSYPEYVEKEDNIIEPGEFLLASTEEQVAIPDHLVGFLYGRSSVGRLGLFVHNAGLIDTGFCGEITLELYNPAPYPIKLEPGMRICQMTLHTLLTVPDEVYCEENLSKYNGQDGPTPSKLHEDF